MAMNILGNLLLLFLVFLVIPQNIFAHGIGQSYTLPIPLTFYLGGSAAVVLISFIIISLFIRPYQSEKSNGAKLLFKIPTFIEDFIKVLSIFLLLLVITTGLFGNQQPDRNFSPNFFWAFFVIFFVISSALINGIWKLVNPINLLVSGIEKIGRGGVNLNINYPEKLNYWPAAVFYFIFIWFELISGLSSQPRILSLLVITYIVFQIWLVIIFGKKHLEKFEFLSVFANLLGNISVLEIENMKIYFKNPLKKLNLNAVSNFSLVIFIILTLTGVAFDSFAESPAFFSILRFLNLENLNFSLVRTLTLLLMIIPYLFLYTFFTYISNKFSKDEKPFLFAAKIFSISLLPISVAYFVAHFFPLLLFQGQVLIALISDPFGIGWNLYQTAGYKINLKIMGVATIWYLQIGLIVIGHILAVLISHLLALNTYKNEKGAILSQYPITLLMVIYTIFSLWLLSQPIVIAPN